MPTTHATPGCSIPPGRLAVLCLLGGLCWAAIYFFVTNLELLLGWLARAVS